ncbi:MAG: phosphotransferase [archaeon]
MGDFFHPHLESFDYDTIVEAFDSGDFSEGFEELFFLKNIRRGIEKGEDGVEWYNDNLNALVDRMFNTIMDSGMRQGVYSSLMSFERLQSKKDLKITDENPEVSLDLHQDTYLVGVMVDVLMGIGRRVIKKKQRSNDYDEFGVGYDRDPERRILRDYLVREILEESVPESIFVVPRHISIDYGMKRNIRMERLKGKTLFELGDTELVMEFIKRLARFHHLMKSVPVNVIGGWDYETELRQGNNLHLQGIEPYVRLMEHWLPQYGRVCHGSLHTKNILYHEGQFGVVDWELCCRDLLFMDLGRVLSMSGDIEEGLDVYYQEMVGLEGGDNEIKRRRFDMLFNVRMVPLYLWAIKNFMEKEERDLYNGDFESSLKKRALWMKQKRRVKESFSRVLELSEGLPEFVDYESRWNRYLGRFNREDFERIGKQIMDYVEKDRGYQMILNSCQERGRKDIARRLAEEHKGLIL